MKDNRGITTDNRELTEEECSFIEAFLEHSANVIGTTLRIPTRVSYSVGDLTMHFYVETSKKSLK